MDMKRETKMKVHRVQPGERLHGLSAAIALEAMYNMYQEDLAEANNLGYQIQKKITKNEFLGESIIWGLGKAYHYNLRAKHEIQKLETVIAALEMNSIPKQHLN